LLGPLARHDALPVYLTPEELEQLPPHPPSLREEAQALGVIEYLRIGAAAEGETLEVPRGARVIVNLVVTLPATGAPDQVTDTLTLYSTTWQRIDVPIRIDVAGLEMTLGASAITVRQGLPSEPLEVTLVSRAGPDTDVHFRLGREGDPFQVHPATVRVERGRGVTTPVRVSVDPNPFLGAYPMYLGDYDLGFEATAYGRDWLLELPLRLTFRPGTLEVRARQSSVTALQGDRAGIDVEAELSGGFKRVNFTAGGLPRGVRMAEVVSHLTGPSVNPVRLELVVDPDARPVVNERATINWSANDGEQTGSFPVRVTVVRRPDSRTFRQRVVTPSGTPLGGEVELVLNNDGTGRFRGHMEATGLLSYKFRVRAVVRSASGRIAVMAQKSGSVYGWDTPGDERFAWDDNASSELLGDQWPEVRTASLVVNRSYDLSGVLGTLADVVTDLVEFVAASAVVSPVLAGVVLVGSELADLTDVHVAGPGGIGGLVLAGGMSFLFGGGVILPIMVGGLIVGDVQVQHRPLLPHEVGFARQVFEDSVPYDLVRITNISGLNGREFVVPNTDGTILLNMGAGFSDPTGYTKPDKGYVRPGQVFIHEMTHAWQVAHTDVTAEFFWRAAVDQLGGDDPYRYGPPGTPFGDLGLEGQASLVDEWFAGTMFRATTPVPGRPTDRQPGPADQMRRDDPYFGYIEDNIRLGQR
jgi:hypothetical protein